MTTYPDPRIRAYRPGTPLDTELAALGYTCLHTWPDQRPITAGLVRSRLRPPAPASRSTLLATIRTPDGQLVAAAALRDPAARGKTGRLWGPLVHPDHQRRGLGTRLLDALTEPITTFPGTVSTAEIPLQRASAIRFFARRSWDRLPPAALLKAPLPLPATRPPNHRARVPADSEDVSTALARLYAAARPREGAVIARGAFARWSADERFTPESLVLAEDDEGELAVAVLVYPLAHTDPTEPAEALVGDILLSPTAPADGRLEQVAITHALALATRNGAHIARAIVSPQDPVAYHCLTALGFTALTPLQQFRPMCPAESGPHE